jgi:hypothetical protein
VLCTPDIAAQITKPSLTPRAVDIKYDPLHQERKIILPGLWIKVGTTMTVRAFNSNSSMTAILIGIEMIAPSGDIMSFNFILIPSTDRSATTLQIAVPEGWLMSVTAIPQGTIPRRGECFCWAQLQIGASTYTTLFAGYLMNDKRLSYPPSFLQDSTDGNGLLRSVLGTNPAAGSEISETVPTNARWKLYGIRFTLVDTAAAATRTVNLIIDDGATTLLQVISQTDQIISETKAYEGHHYGYQPATKANEIYLPLPLPIILLQGWRIRTSTTNINGADDYGAPQMDVEEWIED